MKVTLKYFLLALALSFASLISFSCSCHCGKPSEALVIPTDVLNKADAYLKDKMTEDYFNKYLTLDLWKTQKNDSGYDFAYRFIIPEKPYVNVLIRFSTDSLGSFNAQKDVYGIPDIKSDSTKGIFNIDEIKAKQIAKDAGMAPGVKEWREMFVWNEQYGSYVWIVLNTTEETGKHKSRGSEITINPYSGKILSNKEWHITE